MKIVITIVSAMAVLFFGAADMEVKIVASTTIDSLGACQGVSYQQGKVYLYGDREMGIIRTYTLNSNQLVYTGQEIKLTQNGQDVINHPTGIAHNGSKHTFIGNSIRLNPEGTRWKAVIYAVDWEGLQRTKTLDGNLLNVIEDDVCIQGTRPEYVQYKGKWYVATADYGQKSNEVRLYDPELLRNAKRTSEAGVLFKKFSCSAWVQNLHWIPSKGVLVLIQNQIEGRKWRFTFVDLNKSIASGQQQVLNVVDIDKSDELEGFTLLDGSSTGMAVTSSRHQNVHFVTVK
ncbi:hypothetical protein [Runella aurantiaca]|uniref:Uncharacterized protein n=1 Tax=Runella aurantiaca TaxID=2282308 RepID=A0A369IKK9_9BACT|nr:hypothetical protein [Runella aurantiaca]RDB07774.1 hypothetical protein DVG78_01595 [Runella aurantiaca]